MGNSNQLNENFWIEINFPILDWIYFHEGFKVSNFRRIYS